MKEFFEYIQGCEVIEYHEGSVKRKILFLILSYAPTILMLWLLYVTLMKAYIGIRFNINLTSELLQYMAVGVLILMMEVMARIIKEKKIAELHECCIFRYTDTVSDADMYWITELYDLRAYDADGSWIATLKERGRLC